MTTPSTVQTNGTHAHNDAKSSHADLQAWRDAVAMYTQRAHDYYGPDLAGRIDKARRIVLDGRVKPNGNHAHVLRSDGWLMDGQGISPQQGLEK
jgi:hypothetical protein